MKTDKSVKKLQPKHLKPEIEWSKYKVLSICIFWGIGCGGFVACQVLNLGWPSNIVPP